MEARPGARVDNGTGRSVKGSYRRCYWCRYFNRGGFYFKMESLIIRTKALIEELKLQISPGGIEICLGKYIADGLREGQLSLYEAFLLQAEALGFLNMAYTQAAWNRKVGISILLKILNMKMLSVLFQDKSGANVWTECGIDAYKRNQEVRPHYIVDEYLTYLKAEDKPVYLQRLLKVRQQKKRSFNKGPYHDEVFPYSECNYEELLLNNKRFPSEEKQISEIVENFLVELYLLQENWT